MGRYGYTLGDEGGSVGSLPVGKSHAGSNRLLDAIDPKRPPRLSIPVERH
jgi:hypothetical protein